MLQDQRRSGDRRRAEHNHGRVAQREHEADRNRPLPVLHQFAGYIVDGSYVIGIDGVAQTKAIGEERCSQKYWVMVKRHSRPEPRAKIKDH